MEEEQISHFTMSEIKYELTFELNEGIVPVDVTGLFPGCLASSKVGQSTATGTNDSTAGFFQAGFGG